MKSARTVVALLMMGGVGWLVGSNPGYRPNSLNPWLILSIALASLALVNAWRSASPSGSTRGPMVLIAFSLAIAGAVLWRSEAWVPPTAVMILGVVAAAVGLQRDADILGQYRPFRTVAWVPRPRRWDGKLPVVTKITIAMSSGTLDLSHAELTGSTELHVSVLLARLEIQVPADWPLRLKAPVGLGVRIEGQAGPTVGGPPLELSILGFAGVVALRRF